MAAPLVDTITSAPGAVLTPLYPVPTNRRAQVRLLQVTNIAAAGKTFRIAISPNGAAIANDHYIAYDTALAANDRDAWSGIVLGSSDIVRVYGSDANVVFLISLYEDDV